jgi:hypothetical protein
MPLQLITVQLELKKWADDLKIYNLCREIELHHRAPTFTTRNDSLYIIQLHVKQVDTAFWKRIAELEAVQVFVTDVRKF